LFFWGLFKQREKKRPVIGKEYFNYMDLEGIVAAYPYRKNLSEEDILKGMCFLSDFEHMACCKIFLLECLILEYYNHIPL